MKLIIKKPEQPSVFFKKKNIINCANNIYILDDFELVFLEADSCYTKITLVDNSKIIVSKPIIFFEETLSDKFFRIHHKYIINLSYLKRISKGKNFTVDLCNNITLPVSDRKKIKFCTYVNNHI